VRQALCDEGVTPATLHRLTTDGLHHVVFAVADEDENGRPCWQDLTVNDLRWLMPLHNNRLIRAATSNARERSCVRTFLKDVTAHSEPVGNGHPWPADLSGTREQDAHYQPDTPAMRHMLQAFNTANDAQHKAGASTFLVRQWSSTRAAGDAPHKPSDLRALLPFKQRLTGGHAQQAEKAAPGSNAAFGTRTLHQLHALGMERRRVDHLRTGLCRFVHEAFEQQPDEAALVQAWQAAAEAAAGVTDPAQRVLKMSPAIRQLQSRTARLELYRLHFKLQQRIQAGTQSLANAEWVQWSYIHLSAALQACSLWEVLEAAPACRERFEALPQLVKQAAVRQLDEDRAQAQAGTRGSALQVFERLPLQVQALLTEASTLVRGTSVRNALKGVLSAQGGRWYASVPSNYRSPLRALRALQEAVAHNGLQWNRHDKKIVYSNLVHRSDACWQPGEVPAVIQALRLAQDGNGEGNGDGQGQDLEAALAHLKDHAGIENTKYVRQALQHLLALEGLDEVTAGGMAGDALLPQLQANEQRRQDVAELLQQPGASSQHEVDAALAALGVWMRWRETGAQPPTAANPCHNPVEQALREHDTLEAFHAAVQQDLMGLRQHLQQRREALWTQHQAFSSASAALTHLEQTQQHQLDRQSQECSVQLDAVNLGGPLAQRALTLLYEQAQPLREIEQHARQAEAAGWAEQDPDQPMPEVEQQSLHDDQAANPMAHDALQWDAQLEDEEDGDAWMNELVDFPNFE
jgi:hypothetical protein